MYNLLRMQNMCTAENQKNNTGGTISRVFDLPKTQMVSYRVASDGNHHSVRGGKMHIARKVKKNTMTVKLLGTECSQLFEDVHIQFGKIILTKIRDLLFLLSRCHGAA